MRAALLLLVWPIAAGAQDGGRRTIMLAPIQVEIRFNSAPDPNDLTNLAFTCENLLTATLELQRNGHASIREAALAALTSIVGPSMHEAFEYGGLIHNEISATGDTTYGVTGPFTIREPSKMQPAVGAPTGMLVGTGCGGSSRAVAYYHTHGRGYGEISDAFSCNDIVWADYYQVHGYLLSPAYVFWEYDHGTREARRWDLPDEFESEVVQVTDPCKQFGCGAEVPPQCQVAPPDGGIPSLPPGGAK